jgi:hypothetical protein
MFSYPAGLLQTSAAKRAENQFNSLTATSSGKVIQMRVRLGTCGDSRLGCPAMAQPSGRDHTLAQPIQVINILSWTLAHSSRIMKSLRKPAQQPVPRS